MAKDAICRISVDTQSLHGSTHVGQEERVVATRGASDDHARCALCAVPGSGYDSLARTFAHMLRMLRFNDDTAHRGAQLGRRSCSRR
jgi:hypothetical protein